MDLLEKSSILLTPTAYNNGEALCVKPSDASGDFQFSRNSAATRVNAQGLVENVQILSSNLVQNGDFSELGAEEVSNGSFSQEGSQLITNGDFSSDTAWTKGTGWSISGGSANCDGSQTSDTFFYQGIGNQSNKTVKFSFTVTNYVSGTLKTAFFGAVGTIPNSVTANGNYTFYINVQSGHNGNTGFKAEVGFNGSIDNVSVVEVGQDWDFGTGWSVSEDKAVAVSGTSSKLTQSISGLSGKTCKVSFTLSDFGGSGSVRVDFGSVSSDAINTNGFHTIYGTYDNNAFELFKNTGFTGSITNISVKEVGQNWTLGSATIELGKLTLNSVGGAMTYAYQSGLNLVAGTNYLISLNATRISGDTNLAFGFGAGNNVAGSPIISTSGIQSYNFTPTTNVSSFGLKRNAGGSGAVWDITNISAIEITDDTNLPRINYEGFSYQDALGSELVTNGDFSSPTSWGLFGGATISDGKANIIGDGSAFTYISQSGVFTSGKQYIVKADVVINSGLGLKFQDGATNENIGFATTSGTYTFNFTATANSTILIGRRTGGTPFNSSVDNVSVKEYLGQEVVPNSGCGSWLFEPQSTNLNTYSEDIPQNYVTTEMSDTFGYGIAPNGLQTSTRLQLSNVGTSRYVQVLTGIVLSGNTYTFSCYYKGTQGETAYMYALPVGGTTAVKAITFSGKWQREYLTFMAGSSSNYIYIVDTRQGGNASDFEVWGAQLEQQSYATSYIPTSGSTVTRNQDVCANGGSLATINSTEGVLYAEIAALANDGTSRRITLLESLNNKVSLILSSTSNSIQGLVVSGGSVQFNQTFATSNTLDFNKIAVSYAENNFALWVNGVKVRTDTSGNTPIGLSELSFADGDNTSNKFFGKTKALAVWKEALSDSELQSLTTI